VSRIGASLMLTLASVVRVGLGGRATNFDGGSPGWRSCPLGCRPFSARWVAVRLTAERHPMSASPPGYQTDTRVDHYIDPLADWQQAICRALRELIHAADPELTETIKRTVQPYLVLEGNVCALLAARDHVNLFLYDRGDRPGSRRHRHARPREQDRPNDLLLPRRHDQRSRTDRDPPADHRQQPRRRMAQAQDARQRQLNPCDPQGRASQRKHATRDMRLPNAAALLAALRRAVRRNGRGPASEICGTADRPRCFGPRVPAFARESETPSSWARGERRRQSCWWRIWGD
jgi:hypothetical protein